MQPKTIFLFLLLTAGAASKTIGQTFYKGPGYAFEEPEVDEPEEDTLLPFNKALFTVRTINVVETVAQFDVRGLGKYRTPLRSVMGFTKEKRSIPVYYFPGTSTYKALIVGGMHGSELSSIEVANQLIAQLAAGDTPFYNVIIIPSLFPDNAATALKHVDDIGSNKNIGRYSSNKLPDPNRQMPSIGKPFFKPVDHLGRPIENENVLLLELITQYKPHRMVAIHAIRDINQAGIFADPRTDAAGRAYEYATDSSLAVSMAQLIENNGGTAPGNQLAETPSALYYLDPPVASPGRLQKRSMKGSSVAGNRGQGVSLGTWASTAVVSTKTPALSRLAIRLLTMEFPGYKRSIDYTPAQQKEMEMQVVLYATAIQQVFLKAQFVEETTTPAEEVAGILK